MKKIHLFLLTLLTLCAFAGNSLLCRSALGAGLMDADGFTFLRLFSGALILAVLSYSGKTQVKGAGSWGSALALFTYAASFSFSYLKVTTGTGALILFGFVQLSMIGWGIFRGAHPSGREWGGLSLALLGLFVLTRPGLTAPDPFAAGLMALAGVAWGAYSLRGRGNLNPLGATADNFRRSLVLALFFSVPFWRDFHLTLGGGLLAVASGGLASGLGYSLWYRVLPHLSRSRAAIVQLMVPLLAALGGVLILGESVTTRLLESGALILIGVGLAVTGKKD